MPDQVIGRKIKKENGVLISRPEFLVYSCCGWVTDPVKVEPSHSYTA